MNEEISRINIENELDIVVAYRRAMQIAELTGMTASAQTKFATAVSEICRNVLEHVGVGNIRFKIIVEGNTYVEAIITDKGRGISNVEELLSRNYNDTKLKGCGIPNAKRLTDQFFIESQSDQGTKVRMRIKIPKLHPPINKLIINGWKEYFAREIPVSPYEEIKKQNMILIEMMESLRIKDLEAERQIEEIKRLNNDLDQFAHTVSHDLKAPLRNIEGLLLIMDEDVKEQRFDSISKTSDMMASQVARMDKLIQDILHYSQSGRKNMNKGEVDLNNLIEEITGTLSIPTGFQIHTENLCKLNTEEIYLTQIFSNLITNAVKHHDQTIGNVIVNCRLENDLLTFSVLDDGPGIPFEYQDKIFDMYEMSNSKTADSTGVGLAIVKKIVNEKGGKIWVESDGRGAKFIFTWPVDELCKSEESEQAE